MNRGGWAGEVNRGGWAGEVNRDMVEKMTRLVVLHLS